MVFLGDLILIKGGLEIIKQVKREVEDGNDQLQIKNAFFSQKFFKQVSINDELKQAKVNIINNIDFYKLTVLQVLDIIGSRPTLSVSPTWDFSFKWVVKAR